MSYNPKMPTPYMVEQCRKLLQPLAGNDWPKVARQAYTLMTEAAPKADLDPRLVEWGYTSLDEAITRLGELQANMEAFDGLGEAPTVEQEPEAWNAIEIIARAIDPDAWKHVDACREAMKTCTDEEATRLRGAIDKRLRNSESIPAAERVLASRPAPASDELLKVVEHQEKLLRAICDAPQPKYVEGHLYNAIHDVNGYVAGLNAKRKGNPTLAKPEAPPCDELLEALTLYDVWASTPQDRGGKSGSKGRALEAFLIAKDAAIAKHNGPQS